MTAQIPDKLINEYPGLDLDGLDLYEVLDGETVPTYGRGAPYVFSVKPKNVGDTTALHRGYIATFRLTAEGKLELVKYDYPVVSYDYPSFPECEPDEVHEIAIGDFWLVMKAHSYGTGTYIPFRDGRVVSDRSKWIYPQEELIPHEPTKLILINKYLELDLDRLELCTVIQDDIDSNSGWGEPYQFSFSSKSIQDEDFPPDRWKWHETEFRITEDGELALIGAELVEDKEDIHSAFSRYKVNDLEETAKGDFWLVMREHLSSLRIYVPFRDGRIVPDKSQWIHEERM